MKNLKKVILSLFVALLFLPAFSQEKDNIVVASDRNLEDAEFDQYTTFTFASHIEDMNNNQYFWEDEGLKSAIKEEIRAELQALGYEYVEGSEEEADLVVNFQVLDEDTELTGWENVEPATGYWGFDVDILEREPEDQTTYDLKKGTIMVHLADVENGIEVWRGYASGVVDETPLEEDDAIKIDEAIARIFDEYQYTASR